jgi:hypothetical protein
MKISAAALASLSADIRTVLSALCPTADIRALSIGDMWALFHEVHAQRTHSDSHPRWTNVDRVLQCTHATHNCGYIGSLYGLGLNDSHIETALRSIQKTLPCVVSP